MTNRPRARSLVPVLLAVSLAAQHDLGARLVAAAGNDNWTQAFLQQGLDRIPIGELLEAASAGIAHQPAHIGARIANLLEPRRDEVLAAWRNERDRRGLWTRALAATQLDWIGLYVAAGPEDRADLDAVAAHLVPHQLESSLADPRAGHAAAAAHLLRIAVRGEGERTGLLTMLRSRGPEDPQQRTWLSAPTHALTLGPALRDSDPFVRARAVYALAHRLGLREPIRVTELLADDPVAAVRQHAAARLGEVPLHERNLSELLAMIARGDLPFGINREAAQRLPAAARSALTTALLEAGRKMALSKQPPRLPPAPAAATNPFLSVVAGLGPEMFLTLLGRAQQEDDVAVVRAMLFAAASVRPDPAAAARAAAMVWNLVDHSDPGVAFLAAAMLWPLAAAAPGPELRTRLSERALAIAAQRLGELKLSQGGVGCIAGGDQLGQPTERDAMLVLVAAMQGAVELLPLLRAEAQTRIKADPAVMARADARLGFVLECLGGLAPLVDEADARALHELLGPFVPTTRFTDSTLRGRARGVVLGLFARVPEELLAQYQQWFADPEVRRTFLQAQSKHFAAMPAARARLLLPADGSIDVQLTSLYATCPEQLTAGWHSRSADTRHRAVGVATILLDQAQERMLELLRTDRLPRELLAASCRKVGSLPTLAELLPSDVAADSASVAAWADSMQSAITKAHTGEPEADLAALRTLVGSGVPKVALAAIDRLGAFDEAGRAAAVPELRRLIADSDLQVAGQALTSAVLLGVDLRPEAGQRERIRTASWQGNVAVAAADLRFADGDPNQLEATVAAAAIAVSGREIGVDTWRQLLGARKVTSIPHLSPTSLAALLHALTLVPDWPRDLDRQVIAVTSHEAPAVRAAAYAALATRDQELSARALWHHAAEFDADPQVRAVARR